MWFVLLLGALSRSESIIDPKYATAAWTLPSGEQSNNVLFFPMPGGLAGAFFPLTGIPEVPKAGGGHPVTGSQEALARLQAMSPEQREMVMAQLKRQREMQLQQQQVLANNNNNGGGGPNGNGGGGGHGMFGMNNMMAQQRQQNQHGDIGFGGGVPNYGGGMNMMGMGQQGMMNAGMRVPSNINPEMMQSFMQRNSDGSSGMTGP